MNIIIVNRLSLLNNGIFDNQISHFEKTMHNLIVEYYSVYHEAR